MNVVGVDPLLELFEERRGGRLLPSQEGGWGGKPKNCFWEVGGEERGGRGRRGGRLEAQYHRYKVFMRRWWFQIRKVKESFSSSIIFRTHGEFPF
jgi:hypothetical protein